MGSIPAWGAKIQYALWPKNQNKKKNRSNILTDSIKTLKMVHIKKYKKSKQLISISIQQNTIYQQKCMKYHYTKQYGLISQTQFKAIETSSKRHMLHNCNYVKFKIKLIWSDRSHYTGYPWRDNSVNVYVLCGWFLWWLYFLLIHQTVYVLFSMCIFFTMYVFFSIICINILLQTV